MNGKRLTAQNAIKLMSEFYDLDTEACERGFNWTHAPEVLRSNERVYAYYDDQPWPADTVPDQHAKNIALVGFGILEMNTRDARDTEAFLSCGVFPEHRRKGYWHKIMADMIERARKLGADFCSRTVNVENTEHHRRSMREAFGDSGWIHAGRHWHPAPGYDYFVWLFDADEREQTKKLAKENNGTQP